VVDSGSLSSRETAQPLLFNKALITASSSIAACLMAALAIIDERHAAKSPINITGGGQSL
jgi:hypothetical protein